jgi:hypothetical protein
MGGEKNEILDTGAIDMEHRRRLDIRESYTHTAKQVILKIERNIFRVFLNHLENLETPNKSAFESAARFTLLRSSNGLSRLLR